MKTRAIFVDFGGVLTTSVFEGFRAFARSVGVAPELPFRLLASDPLVNSAFVEFETGRLTDEHFETVMATALTEHGGTVEATGLLRRMRAGIRPDVAMIELIAGIKAAGHPVALVSNSLGRGCYDGVDLDTLVDVAVVSAEVGLRKPSRAIYQLACRKLGVEPADVVMIDDLPHNIDGAHLAGIDGIVHGDAATTAEELATRFGVFPQLPPTPNRPKTIWRRPRSTHWMR
ncbi:HAD family hydrolase [Nocardia sp. NPDC047654]|uniref:HAD family hydrolase n=1 Tax=Nocardia sp. NPDC047654 TaxID=3364314 RepID=UPI003715B865